MGSAVRARINGIMVKLPLTASVGEALSVLPPDGWVGITAEDGSVVCLAARGDLQAERHSVSLATIARLSPPLVTVNADVPVAEAVRSPAFRALSPRRPVLVEDAGGPLGVWAGQNLAEAFVGYGSNRASSDVGLQGDINIGGVRMVCKYQEEPRSCLATQTFLELPDEYPQCPNPHHLSEHIFTA
jgi:hypothetical protein